MRTRTHTNHAQLCWTRLARKESLLAHTEDGVLFQSYAGYSAFQGEEILAHRQYLDAGIFRRLALNETAPRLLTVASFGGTPRAWAMLFPTTTEHCGGALVPLDLGRGIGLLGCWVDPDLRGRGLAKHCLESLAKRIDTTLGSAGLLDGTCLVAEARIIELCRPISNVPVIARWMTARDSMADHDYAFQLSCARKDAEREMAAKTLIEA
jgi:ribosomal protein S18 acetylase RimI-like enzyme